MCRSIGACFILITAVWTVAQTSPQPTASDPQALSFAQKSVAALIAGVPLSDVTLNANVIWIAGSDNETGTGTFSAKGFSESRVDLNLSGGTRSDVRNISSNVVGGVWQKNGSVPSNYASHNCMTDAAWFLPTLSSLTQSANQSFIFKYVGQEPHAGVATQHIRVFQVFAQDPAGVLQSLSTMDFYLDVNSNLPLAVAFVIHPDDDLTVNIGMEVRFANYQSASGIMVPFHIQKLIGGTVTLDITVTSVAVNSGLADAVFSLQ